MGRLTPQKGFKMENKNENKNTTAEGPQISFYEKSVYGNPFLYPCLDRAKTFTNLTGKKTATPVHIEALRELGFCITILRPSTGFETLAPLGPRGRP